jgi:ABC-type uncharacterized transport system substrate-binding protein
MRRRDLIAAVAATMAMRRTPAIAEQKMPVVGVLVSGTPNPDQPLKIFRASLAQLGYVEGRDIRLELRSAEGHSERLPALAAELVRERVDVILAWQTPVVLAAKQATATIPIVMLGAADPVGSGFVATLARPGGNITGVAGLTAELGAKLVELLKQLLPPLKRIAALCNIPDPFSQPFLKAIDLAGAKIGIPIEPVRIHSANELDSVFAALRGDRPDAIIVQPSLPLQRVAELAIAAHLPAASPHSVFPEVGGLMGYSADPDDYYSRPAAFVDKILKGAKPADLPVEQPTTYELTINARTAKALALTVPEPLLARADKVIE